MINHLPMESFNISKNVDATRNARKYWKFHHIFWLIFTANLWTLTLTFLPVFVEIPPKNYYKKHDNWYTGNDVVRFLEPLGLLPLNFGILLASGIFNYPDQNALICIFCFMFAAALTEQGAGFHSTSNMLKNALESIPIANQDDIYDDLYYYIRTIWQHEVSHYIYATGYILMAVAFLYAYKDYKQEEDLNWSSKLLVVSAAFLYGLLIAGVAANFPSGVIVGLVFVLVYGFGFVGTYTYLREREGELNTAFRFGSRPILHYFVLSYIIAFILIILWIAAVGGIKTRSQAT